MTPDELLALLSEKPPEVDSGVDDGLDDGVLPSSTVLNVDDWTLRQAESLQQYDWGKEHSTEELADAFGACFEPRPVLATKPQDRVRSRWFRELIESPDYAALHVSTQGDVMISQVGARSLVEQWGEFTDRLDDDRREEIENGEESTETELKIMCSVDKAVAEAAEEAEQVQGVAAGLGMGGDGQPLDMGRVSEAYNRVRNSPLLKRICDKAGRFRRSAQSKQRRKTVHGMDDTVGVTLGGDINLLVPGELALLMDDDRELDALRRIAERQAMQRDHRGIERVGKGPVVVCVDESGSMSGEKIENAKAFALSLAWMARHQNRWCALVGYSGGTEGTRMALPPGRWDETALMEWLEHFYSGGTTLDVPLVQLPTVYWDELSCPKGKTDVILITDAIVHAPSDVVETFNAWRATEKAKCYGIVLGSSPGDLEKVCDRTWSIDALGVEQDCVGELLSL